MAESLVWQCVLCPETVLNLDEVALDFGSRSDGGTWHYKCICHDCGVKMTPEGKPNRREFWVWPKPTAREATAAEVLAKVRAAGFTVALTAGDGLAVSPSDGMTDLQIAIIHDYAPRLIALLKAERAAEAPPLQHQDDDDYHPFVYV